MVIMGYHALWGSLQRLRCCGRTGGKAGLGRSSHVKPPRWQAAPTRQKNLWTVHEDADEASTATAIAFRSSSSRTFAQSLPWHGCYRQKNRCMVLLVHPSLPPWGECIAEISSDHGHCPTKLSIHCQHLRQGNCQEACFSFQTTDTVPQN